jgi:glutathione peroxidase-family protein
MTSTSYLRFLRSLFFPLLIFAAFVRFGCSGEGESPEIGTIMVDSTSSTGSLPGADALDSAFDSQSRASDLILTDIDDVTFSLSEYHGSVIMIDFWRTDSERNRERLDLLKELLSDYRPEGFEVIGVAMNVISKDALVKLRQRHKLPFTIVQGAYEFNFGSQLSKRFPISYIYDRDGHVANRFIGAQDKEIYVKQIETLLNKT